MTYGDKIKENMEKAGLTIKELSEKTNISEFVLERYVEGLRIPKATDLIDLSKAFGIEPNDLIGD